MFIPGWMKTRSTHENEAIREKLKALGKEIQGQTRLIEEAIQAKSGQKCKLEVDRK